MNLHKKVVNFGSLPRTWLISPAVKMLLVGRQTGLSHRSACWEQDSLLRGYQAMFCLATAWNFRAGSKRICPFKILFKITEIFGQKWSVNHSSCQVLDYRTSELLDTHTHTHKDQLGYYSSTLIMVLLLPLSLQVKSKQLQSTHS